jgi:hypothetical protein
VSLFIHCCTECHCTECRYAARHYAECRYAERHCAECRYAECHDAPTAPNFYPLSNQSLTYQSPDSFLSPRCYKTFLQPRDKLERFSMVGISSIV